MELQACVHISPSTDQRFGSLYLNSTTSFIERPILFFENDTRVTSIRRVRPASLSHPSIVMLNIRSWWSESLERRWWEFCTNTKWPQRSRSSEPWLKWRHTKRDGIRIRNAIQSVRPLENSRASIGPRRRRWHWIDSGRSCGGNSFERLCQYSSMFDLKWNCFEALHNRIDSINEDREREDEMIFSFAQKSNHCYRRGQKRPNESDTCSSNSYRI